MTRQFTPYRRAVRAAGLLVTLISLGFVGWGLLADDVLHDPAWRQVDLWWKVAMGAATYTLLLCLLAAGWLLLLRSASDGRLSWREGFAIYAVTQIYKYLPLNILHLVGRHALLRKARIGHSTALWAAGAEIALLLMAASAIAVGAGSATLPGDRRIWVWVVGVSAVILIGPFVLRMALSRLRRAGAPGAALERLARPRIALAAFQAFGLALLFFAGAGLILAGMVGTAAPAAVPILLGLWAGAWAIGFVTPGAAAGVGVRELLLIAGLASLGADKAVLIACVMRVVTTAGDALFAALGLAAGLHRAPRMSTQRDGTLSATGSNPDEEIGGDPALVA